MFYYLPFIPDGTAHLILYCIENVFFLSCYVTRPFRGLLAGHLPVRVMGPSGAASIVAETMSYLRLLCGRPEWELITLAYFQCPQVKKVNSYSHAYIFSCTLSLRTQCVHVPMHILSSDSACTGWSSYEACEAVRLCAVSPLGFSRGNGISSSVTADYTTRAGSGWSSRVLPSVSCLGRQQGQLLTLPLDTFDQVQGHSDAP